MTYKPIPTKTEDGEKKVVSSNDRLLEVALAVDTKLAIILKYLSYLSDETFTEEDIEDN